MQVYRRMNIGTAKPEALDVERLPHHLIDIRNPDEHFDLGDFVPLVDETVREIAARDRIPVVAGGTAFYLQGYLYGLPNTPEGDPAVRAGIEERLASDGLESLRGELESIDPESNARIEKNDAYRVVRALEVYRVSGRPLSSFSEPKEIRPGLNAVVVGLFRDREELYRRINARVDRMMRDGLPEEVANLIGAGYGIGDPGMRAIGYREFLEFPAGPPWTATHLGEIARRISRDTRRYAKRQMTFFRRLPDIRWIHADDTEAFLRLLTAYSAFRHTSRSIR